MIKICAHCKEEKPIAKYMLDSRYKDGYRSTCRPCRTVQSRDSQIRTRYGFERDEYEAFLESHNFECDVCGSKKNLGVDHDHESGIVRGLLCSNCNTALGLVKDSNERLEALIDYLEKSKTSLSYS